MTWNNGKKEKIAQYLRECDATIKECHLCKGVGFIAVNERTMRHCDCKLNVARPNGFLYRFIKEGACHDATFFATAAFDGSEVEIQEARWPT